MQDNMFKLGKSLVKQNVVKFEMLEQAMKIKQKEEHAGRRNLAQILVSDFQADRDMVFLELAKLYGIQTIDLSKLKIDDKRIKFIKKMMDRLPEQLKELAEKEQILVYDYQKVPTTKFVFVSVDPTNRNIAIIARAMGVKRQEVRHIGSDDFQTLFSRALAPENEYLKNIAESDIELSDGGEGVETLDEEAIDAEINKSLLVNLIEGMLVEAVRKGASDIHVIPINTRDTEIHFRVDGRLRPWYTQKGVHPEAIAAVVKDRSRNIDRFKREDAQDGFIQRTIDNHKIRFRVSVLPVVGQEIQHKLESIVIRILDDRNVITDFEDLGFQEKARNDFIKAISKPQGMVILTGPTGSGKSTTLLASLSYIKSPEINILTVEDPVEYLIPGVRQLKIGPHLDFEQAIRSILRHDPDVVMVGEIRDQATAEIAIKLANTGHLTFSTLHTNDAPSAVARMYKMGIEPFLLAYAINIIIAQRLVRQLCNHCKRVSRDIDPVIPLSLGFTNTELIDAVFYEAVGCDKCHRGYRGRIAIHEALFITKEIRNIIFTSGIEINEEAIRQQALKEGMLTLRGSCRERVRQGLTTLDELAYATSEDD